MKLVPYDEEKIYKRNYKRGKNQLVFEEFLKLNVNCVEVLNFEHKNAFVCAGALRKSANRFGVYNVEVCTRNGKVFLIKKKD